MEVEIISKEVIKPSKPTPSHCKLYKLSSIDQLSPSIYVPFLLFYQPPSTPFERASLSSKLKNSLSETLTYYYPFAGKLKDGAFIDCDDEGVLFVEARVQNNLLADVLTMPKLEAFSTLFPEHMQWKSSKNSTVLAIQLNYFDCGGLCIGICISHKTADACTISTFLNDWASHARLSAGNDGWSISPLFNTASMIFPPNERFAIPELEVTEGDTVTRRCVFNPANISELKQVILSNSEVLQNPTRVEAVTSLISKAIIRATRIRSFGLVKEHKLAHTVNLRPRIVPPLPRNTIGNVVWYFPVTVKDSDDISLGYLAAQMREGLVKLTEFARNLGGDNWLSMAEEVQNARKQQQVMDQACSFSSWCKHPVYEVDFGWGSPTWVSQAKYPYKNNNVFLMDTKDGKGIEAFMTVNEEIMYILEGDDEFLKYASLDPSIQNTSDD